MDNEDYADILLIESFIEPKKKMLMSTLGIKLRKPIGKQDKTKCKTCKGNEEKLHERLRLNISKNKIRKFNNIEKLLRNYTCNSRMDEIVFDFNSNNMKKHSTRTIDSLYSLRNKDLKETFVAPDNKITDVAIHPINSINLESLERHVRENVLVIEDEERKIEKEKYISSSLFDKVKEIEKTKLQIKVHEITDPTKYEKHFSINSIAGEITPLEPVKDESTYHKEETEDYKVLSNNDEFMTTQEIYEIDTCLRISDLRKSQLYGRLEERGENGKFQETYFKLEKQTLICYNHIKNLQKAEDLSIPTISDYFYEQKYELNLLNVKIYLVINKKIEGAMNGLKSIFFKQKKDFIDLSNKLIKNVIDVKKDVYKVVLADQKDEISFILPVLEFSIEFEGNYYFYRTNNSSSFLRWLFTLLSRSGNPKYLH